jgi:hypothetical protein
MEPTAAYQVVARRYRPQRFDELVGQEHVARGLSGAIVSGRIGHATHQPCAEQRHCCKPHRMSPPDIRSVTAPPLAATSFQAAIRWMGGRKWQLLHRLAYVAAAAGVVHFFWQGKAALWTPIYYGVFLGVLLLYRAVYWVVKR